MSHYAEGSGVRSTVALNKNFKASLQARACNKCQWGGGGGGGGDLIQEVHIMLCARN